MMEAGGGETFVGRDVDVDKPRLVLGAAARENGPGMGLVGALVLGKADVAVEPEQRGLAVAPQRDAGVGEGGGKVFDEIAERGLDLRFVSCAVFLEPFPGLMEAERLEEGQGVGAESFE